MTVLHCAACDSLALCCILSLLFSERIAAENEALRRDIGSLNGRLKQAQQLQEMASMLQESHKSVAPVFLILAASFKIALRVVCVNCFSNMRSWFYERLHTFVKIFE